MSNGVSRREAIQRIAISAALLAGGGALAKARFDRGDETRAGQVRDRQVRDFGAKARPEQPSLAIAKSTQEPEVLARRAVEALGGMKRFVSRGDVVAIKPNIGWDRLPVHAANTNPRVVAELVKLALQAGAGRVVVTDASCNEPNRCFQRSGIWRAAYDAGATVILPAEHRFRELRLHGDVLDTWPVLTPILDADKVINVPVAKHHNLARYTGAMKNWYGLLGGRRNRLHQELDASIADLATFLRPTLTVVDATRVLMRNGPQGGNIDDARDVFQVVASIDQVAADAYACTLIGERPQNIGYLKLAQGRGLGTTDWQRLRHVEV
ncbi:MAG: DUF362 domain-containing protein [Polyangiaceae bacterium]|nr:DUF362 domain-containing protein [Polyangiaceae bacterium]